MKTLLTILIAIVAMTNGHAQTPIGGVISTNTTLTLSSSPYVVTSNVLVTIGTTLTIDPGVEVRFKDSLYIQVNGTIRAIGTPQSRILFQLEPGENVGWGGIRIMNSAIDYDSITGNGCVISYADFTETIPVPVDLFYYTATIHCLMSTALLDNLDVSCCSSGLFFDQSNSILRNSVIHDNTYLSIYTEPFLLPQVTTQARFENNHVYNNSFPNNTGSVMFDLRGSARLDGNCIENITCDMVIRARFNNIQILNNKIENCYGVAIGLLGGSDTTQVIVGNQLTNNRIHFVFPSCVRFPVITGNNINSFMQQAVVCTTYYYPFLPDDCPTTSSPSFVYNMQGNYWGSLTTPTQIAAAIQDFDDNFQHLIDIDYTNALSSPAPFTNPAACNYYGVNCTTLTVQENREIEEPLKVWPNPVNGDELNITNVNSDVSFFAIYSIDARCVKQGQLNSANQITTISTADLPNGIYSLQVTSDESGLQSRKIIISR
jgi:Secretion system C-terminal sorting domain/Right handed beta helix region